jgi:AraC family transcriptional regulator of adaptative response/methylated-DNA-[protein]-cysteine methyltransferase
MIKERDYRRIEDTIHWVNGNFRSQPSVSQMAEVAHLSPFHFSRLFREWAGISPQKYLRIVIHESARTELARGGGLLQAAVDLGLSGPGRLHDLFVDMEAVSPGEYRSGGQDINIRYGEADSPFGTCAIASTPRGICSLEFVTADSSDQFVASLARKWPFANLQADPGSAAAIAHSIFTSTQESRLRVHIQGTNFQIQVWKALLRLAAGEMTSYGALARAVDRPGAARAVGGAVGSNPVAWLIPCHRVLRSDGQLGGYHWGTRRKEAMLAWEATHSMSAPD